ncbi:MAG: S1 RNA-binding domain-containing protein [Spirochaetes bacterium]|nr:S1 RNA-binding domain-containing protein [Spirochaetota bacterium]
MDKDIISDENFDFKKAFEESLVEYHENTVIKAKVEQIVNDTIFLNFGYKAEAKLLTSEFTKLPKIGDEIEVYLVRLEGRNGEPIVSKKRVENIKDKMELRKIKSEDKFIKGMVTDVNKSGAFVTFKSLTGFIPLYIFDITQVNLEDFKNKEIGYYVEKVIEPSGDHDKNRKQKEEFIGNRKRYVINSKRYNKDIFFDEKQPGDVVEGVVKNITDFGAFIDIDGVDALLRFKDISWYRFNNINDVLKENQKVKVVILNVNKSKKKCSVGLKQLQEDPWNKFANEYKVDDVIVGNVVSLMPYGAFIRIIEGVEGLLHISDMSWIKKINNPSELLKVGQNLELKIIKIDQENKKISLSLKHLLDNPWEKAKDKYKVGTKIKGKIKDITSFGCFIELEEGIDALLHIDDVSWIETIKNPNDYFKIDQEIEAVVINCDAEKTKIKVGIKQLEEDPWKILKDKYNKGDIIKCKILEVDDTKGVFVEVIDKLKSLIPINHLGIEKKYDINVNLRNDFKVGDEIEVLITLIDYKTRKINLSLKDLMKLKEREHVKEFLHDANEDSVYTLSDSINLKNKKK